MFRFGPCAHYYLMRNPSICRGYLSQNFKGVLENHKPPKELGNYTANLTAISLDNLVQRLPTLEDRKSDVFEQLVKLRSTAEATELLESTSFAILKHFLDIHAFNELLPILRKRLDYGIFIDEIIGCYIMDKLLEAKECSAAAVIAFEHMLQEDLDNKLVLALGMKSCYEYFKECSSGKHTAENTTEINDTAPEKIRVKFVRNSYENDFDSNAPLPILIGRTFIKMAEKCDKNVSMDIFVIGHLMASNYDVVLDTLQKHYSELCRDTITHCLEFVSNNQCDTAVMETLKSIAEKKCREDNFDSLLTSLLESAIKIHEPQMIEHQKLKWVEWEKKREQRYQDDIVKANRLAQEDKSANILDDFAAKQDLLWFFENEEKIDLKLFSKKITYPKRWFGKKKKPRFVDASYIPPEIRRN